MNIRPARIERVSKDRAIVWIPQRFLRYPEVEYQLWSDPKASVALRKGFSDRVGHMHRRPVIETQRESHPPWNYAEFKLADEILIKQLGFHPQDLVNENFRLSATKLSAGGKYLPTGMSIVRRGLTDRFFEFFDHLFDANREQYRTDRAASNVHVDLAASSTDLRAWGIWEAKKYPPGAARHEGIEPHQRLVLAVAAFLTQDSRARPLSVKPDILYTACEIVVLHSDADERPPHEPNELPLDLYIGSLALP